MNLSLSFAIGSAALQAGGGKLRPSNEYIVAAGDSRTAQAYDDTTGRFYLESRGAHAWAQPASGHRFRMRLPQYGVGSDTSAMLLARWATVLADSAGTIGLLIGTNDRGSANMTLQQSIDNVTSMLDQALAAGKVVILGNEMQRFTPNDLAGQQLQNHLDFHAWLDLAPSRWRNVYGWDTWSVITADDLGDGLHPNTKGGKKTGETLAASVMQAFPAVDYSRPWTSGEVTDRPALNANPALAGTTGSKGTGITGNLATSWSASLSSTASAAGVTVVCSKETIGDVEYQVFTSSGTTGAGTNTLTMRPTTDVAVVAGEAWDTRGEIILDAGSTAILSAQFESRVDIGGTLTVTRSMDGYQSPDFVPAEGFDMRQCTPLVTVPVGTIASLRGELLVTFAPSTTIACVVKVAKVAIRKAP